MSVYLVCYYLHTHITDRTCDGDITVSWESSDKSSDGATVTMGEPAKSIIATIVICDKYIFECEIIYLLFVLLSSVSPVCCQV